MATPIPVHPKPNGERSTASTPTLLERLSTVLPKGYKFGVYHLSTPPTRTDALYSAPPGERPDKTYWENHFLAVSVDAPSEAPVGSKRASPGAEEAKDTTKKVFVLALEVFIFTTAYSTTLFVSKADSTGYLHLLKLPKGTPSPIREVTAAFIDHLIENRRREGTQLVISLFARAQDQYLFPLSVENKGKHVLDDRGLVKWWCRVLDPLLAGERELGPWESRKGYLTVPGLEQNETRFFLPRPSAAPATSWVLGHPMEQISHYTREFDWVPPRCLIPRYPDDPKSRFRDELDDESLQSTEATGRWNSVQTLEQFWEMMAFRQECSSGRLTGFIWVVFDPRETEAPVPERPVTPPPSQQLISPNVSFNSSMPPPATPPRRRASILSPSPEKHGLTPGTPVSSSPSKLTTAEAQEEKSKGKKRLRGRIVPRLPRVKRTRDFTKLPTTTAFYHWPTEGRGEVIVDASDYKRIVEMLLHLNFKSLGQASSSTMRWIGQVVASGEWGRQVEGTRSTPVLNTAENTVAGAVTNLTGLVRKKPKTESQEQPAPAGGPGPVNVLGAGLIRKKAKAV
ncbi:hypothetical protein GQ53DRAFT_744108 [Thozetella sp. PMI_491]|nr:hypothetical protein GQ53DRAFT_744108 [Thozetella sp. PMI_491]